MVEVEVPEWDIYPGEESDDEVELEEEDSEDEEDSDTEDVDEPGVMEDEEEDSEEDPEEDKPPELYHYSLDKVKTKGRMSNIDGLDRSTRYKFEQRGLLTKYYELFSNNGPVYDAESYRKWLDKNGPNFNHRCGPHSVPARPATSRSDRCRARKKERSEAQLLEGAEWDDTVYGRYLAQQRESKSKKEPCPYCLSLYSHGELNKHIHNIHVRFSQRLIPITEEERAKVAADTVGNMWRGDHRGGRVTAGWAGKVFRRVSANIGNLVRRMYRRGCRGNGYRSYAMRRGLLLEPEVRRRYANLIGVNVEPSGLQVHPDYPYLAATPDGLLTTLKGEEGCVEIKCPLVPAAEVATRKGGNFLVQDHMGGLHMNTNHIYYDQVVMQLICSNRAWCDFVVYHPDSKFSDGLDFIQRVDREEALVHWDKMLPKLTAFFHAHAGPPALLTHPKAA